MKDHKDQLFGIDQAKLNQMLEKYSDAQLLRIRDHVPKARGRFAREVRDSLRKSVRRVYEELTNVPGGLVNSGREAVTLVYEALHLRHSRSSSFDTFDDVQLPVFQGLLKVADEYSWGGASCSPGSISMIVAVAEARLEDDGAGDADHPTDGLQRSLNLGQLLHALEQMTGDATQAERLRGELQHRLKLYAGQGGERETRLRNALELMTDGEHYEFAINELRGMIFTAVYEEFKGTFFRRRDEMRQMERMVDNLSDGVKSHLVDLSRVADLLVRVLRENPTTLGAALEGRAPATPLLKVQSLAE